MLGVRYPTLLQPCSLFASLYHHIDKPYGITISLPPYSNMFVVLTYLKSVEDYDVDVRNIRNGVVDIRNNVVVKCCK